MEGGDGAGGVNNPSGMVILRAFYKVHKELFCVTGLSRGWEGGPE